MANTCTHIHQTPNSPRADKTVAMTQQTRTTTHTRLEGVNPSQVDSNFEQSCCVTTAAATTTTIISSSRTSSSSSSASNSHLELRNDDRKQPLSLSHCAARSQLDAADATINTHHIPSTSTTKTDPLRPNNPLRRYSHAPVPRHFRSSRARLCVAMSLLAVLTGALVARAEFETEEETTTTSGGELLPVASPTTTTTAMPSSASSQDSGAQDSANNQTSGQPAKHKSVNFTLVEQVYNSVLSEPEVVDKWRSMDTQLQDGIKSILKMIFPQIVALSQDAKVSGECSGGILKWILSLRNLRSWAIKMLDATGKPTAGMFEGSMTMFGNYRQCLSVRAPDEDEIEVTDQFEEYFRGKFCVIHLRPWLPAKQPYYNMNATIEPLLRKSYKYYEKTLYDELAELAIAFQFMQVRMDVCVPSTCTAADIQRVVEMLSKKVELRAKVLRCDTASRPASSPDGSPATLLSSLDKQTIFWVAVPLSLISLALVCTLVTWIFQCCGKNTSKSTLLGLIEALSLWGALRGRFETGTANGNDRTSSPGQAQASGSEPGSGSDLESKQMASTSLVVIDLNAANLKAPSALHGLRSLFVLWFLIVQMTVEVDYQYLRESISLRQMVFSYWPFQLIVNSLLLFESLICVTAFTFAYTCLCGSQVSSGGQIWSSVQYLFTKYVRLVLPIAFVIALTIVTPLVSIESPLWLNYVESQSSVCKSTGYINLFFLQNLISYDKMCLPHTWLFCVEFQLAILTIPLMLMLKGTYATIEESVLPSKFAPKRYDTQIESHKPLLGPILRHLIVSKAGLLSLLLIIAGFGLNFYLVHLFGLPPSWFYTFPDQEQKALYFGQYFAKTWTHLSVFLIGLLGGFICKSYDNLVFKTSTRRALGEPLGVKQINLTLSPAVSLATVQTNLKSSDSGSTSSFDTSSQPGDLTIIHQHTTGPSDPQAQHKNQLQFTESESQSSTGSQAAIASRTENSWCLAMTVMPAGIVAMLAVLVSTFAWSTSDEHPSSLIAASYDCLSKLIWSLVLIGLATLISRPDSLMSHLMSYPVPLVCGRLSFLAYLLGPYVHTLVSAVQEQSLYPSLYLMFHVILGNIVIIYSLAFVLAIVIEQPTKRFISKLIRSS